MRESKQWIPGMLAASLLAALLGCGGQAAAPHPVPPVRTGGPDAGVEAIITIQNLTFSPDDLEVSPGQTVLVRNMDAFPHTVTSQSAPDQYVPGAVAGISFDTGPITGESSFTIPSTAPRGTVIPYFCNIHKQGMANDGKITIK